MIRILLLICILNFIACESEKIPYHCPTSENLDGSLSDISDIMNNPDYINPDIKTPPAINDTTDIDIFDSTTTDLSLSDISLTDIKGPDIISGKPCSKVGVTAECGVDESCYPFIECGGICRKCGSSTVGSNCEIHSDCKCGMVCLSLTDKKLTCYKVCKDNTDCPSGQTCTDGWGDKYEHEYYKICKGLINKTEEGK